MSGGFLEWVKTHRQAIDHFQVFGERRTGTNYLDHLIADNFEIEPRYNYGWKHGFATMPCIARSGLILVAVRHPISWLSSLYNEPFSKSHRELNTFSEFLHREWYDEYAPKHIGHRTWGYKGMPRDFKTANQLDRNPLTGKRFRNPLEMRFLKNQSYLGFLERESNVAVIDYDFAKDEPQTVINILSGAFSLTPKDTLSLPPRVGPPGRCIPRISESDISTEDLSFIRSSLDRNQEVRLGYGSVFED